MLWGYFVEGAPATINANIETSNIVNGCDAVLHSLLLADDDDGQRLRTLVDEAYELLAREATVGDNDELVVPILVGQRSEAV